MTRAGSPGKAGRRSPWLRFAALALALVIGAGGARAGQPAALADTVVLLSIDGMRWDDPARAGASSLLSMAREGAAAESGLLPPFPASTFPAHATLATGVHPDRHGILNNEFFDHARGLFRKDDDASWLLAEPLWVTAERQGVRTAVDGWVCASTPWRGTIPTFRVPFAERGSDTKVIDHVVEWLRRSGPDRPRLVLAYLEGPDAAGHETGPGSPQVREAVTRADRLVGRVLRTIATVGRPVALLVVSDHGMASVSRTIRTDQLLRGEARRVRVVSTGATSNIYCPSGRAACDAAASILRSVPGLSVYGADELPADLRYRVPGRTGDLVAIAPLGSWFTSEETRRDKPVRGMHGYRPSEPTMRGIFYAWGAGLRRGVRKDLVRSIDIDPLVCRLLGIAPPEGIDGAAPDELLVSVTRPAATPARATPTQARPARAPGPPLRVGGGSGAPP